MTTTEMIDVEQVVDRVCDGTRWVKVAHDEIAIYPPNSENGLKIQERLWKTRLVSGGREGWEYLRGIGVVQFVRAFLVSGVLVRIVSAPLHPNGMFSNLDRLEEKVVVPLR